MQYLRALVLGIILALAAPLAAQAGSGHTPWPRIDRPVAEQRDGFTRIQIEGPKRVWGMRHVARRTARATPGLRIDAWGRCSDRPRWVCVKVTKKNWGKTGWMGSATATKPRDRNVFLNTYWGRRQPGHRRHIAAHEFGHTLGMSHHGRWGFLGDRSVSTDWWSWAERRAIRRAYRR